MKGTVLVVAVAVAGALGCDLARHEDTPDSVSDETLRAKSSDVANPNRSRRREFVTAIRNGNTTGTIEALRFGEVNKMGDPIFPDPIFPNYPGLSRTL